MTLTPCLEPFCGRVASPKGRGRCEVHARERNRETHRTGRLTPSTGRMYGKKRWLMLRRRVLFDQPMCAWCGDIATQVDHIVPIEKGGEPWSRENCQALCGPCHSRKSRAEVHG
jgi:5-methylcytosine-specific restriction protein A